MDRWPPFGQCLILFATAAHNWSGLTVEWATAGVDYWSWSARLFFDVIAARVVAAAAAGGDPLAADRAAAKVEPDGLSGWGTVTADEAASIMARDNR